MKLNKLSFDRKDEIKDLYQVGDLCAKVLASKELDNDSIKDILSSDEFIDPFQANGLPEVITRIQYAKEHNEKVLVCGDYDADGICATTILYDALQRYGIDCGFYIPNRFREGYGLHPHTVVMAQEKDYKLLITVDNGVKATEALKTAMNANIDVIVTDHHTMDEEIPCTFLLHPLHMGEDFHTLCGAGVALQISLALLGEIKEHVVLACVASIGDVMILRKQTRKIVKRGLRYLKEGVYEAIQLLSNDAYPKWDERMIAFQVVPKLNATGRLADIANANNSVRYLLMDNRMQMIAFVKQINDLNNKRRTMSTKMSNQARSLVQDNLHFQILYQEDFHEGMVGLAAGKISNELHQPVMVLAGENGILKGSIRSYGELDLRDFFDGCKDLLLAYGGHKAAAGISFAKENLTKIQAYVEEKMNALAISEEEECIDVICTSLHELSVDEVAQIDALTPFGEGLQKPIFYISDYEVSSVKELSNHKHVKWESIKNVDALYFNAKNIYETYKDETRVSFVGTLSINHFRNERKVNILVDEVIS